MSEFLVCLTCPVSGEQGEIKAGNGDGTKSRTFVAYCRPFLSFTDFVFRVTSQVLMCTRSVVPFYPKFSQKFRSLSRYSPTSIKRPPSITFVFLN